MKSLAMFLLVLLFSVPCYGQWPELYRPDYSSGYERFGSHPYRYSASPPKLYSGGKYLGELSADRYAPDSVSNPYGAYGSRYSPTSVNNPHSRYGKYSTQPIYIYRPYW